ncbi:hypothetical protein CLV94_1114 [Flavobacterium endophyticum]|uniref:Uncharacterized protein n=1 Tax=Flavobacterium endophyticum TaxID=1540163 RepID=A0A495MLY1_9FLAO|nr:hypothetical protein [Flavobacterium endophyticum]RKS26062.1 hypothetical protein CLV94_1114 [Flavobacterium endophyticum]
MKNRLVTILLGALATGSVYAQNTGVNTKNPKSPLHVDAGKDNNASGDPDAAQQANDFIVTNAGNVGIGTLSPSHKLDLRGKIQIKDGGERAGSILTTDATGLARWISPSVVKPLVNGTFPTTDPGLIVPNGGMAPIDSKISITLSRGKWMVHAGVTFTNGNSTLFQRCYLSSATNALQQTGFNFLGPAGVQTSYGGVLVQGLMDTNPTPLMQFGFVTGSTLIEVTAPSVVIYLLLQNQPVGAYKFNPKTYLENYFFAKPVD